MRTIISPAKNMKVRTREGLTLSNCRFPEKTETVIRTLKKMYAMGFGKLYEDQ